MNTPQKLLVIRLSALGDVAMTIPVIYSLARQYPQLDITVLTRQFFSRLFVNPPANLHLQIAHTRDKHSGLGGAIRLAMQMRALKFDAVADFHDMLRSRIIDTTLWLSGAKVAVVRKNRAARRRLTHRSADEPLQSQRSYIDRYADVLARLGLPVKLDFRSLFPDMEREPMTVGIAPFARYATKTYPTALTEHVISLLSRNGFKIKLFGGASGPEFDTLQRWAAMYPGCENLAGKQGIEDELKLIGRLKLMVSMDSANMHLASLTGTPVLSIWGGTTPECGFMGYGQSADNAMVLNLPCQPCSVAGTTKCPLGTMACLKDLAPEAIVDRIIDMTAE